jgi:hypothetical protein
LRNDHQRARSQRELTGAVAKALDRCQFKIPNTSPVAHRIAELMRIECAQHQIHSDTDQDVRVGGDEVVVIGVVDR